MKDKLEAIKQKLKSPAVQQRLIGYSIGVIAGSAATIVYNRKLFSDVRNGRALILGEDAYNALINDETNFVRFTSNKSEHAFRVTLEQWI